MKRNAVLEPQPGGGYTAYIPTLRGCVSEGDSIKEARANILDAVRGYLVAANKRALSSARPKGTRTITLKV